jgi:hypothetical protein
VRVREYSAPFNGDNLAVEHSEPDGQENSLSNKKRLSDVPEHLRPFADIVSSTSIESRSQLGSIPITSPHRLICSIRCTIIYPLSEILCNTLGVADERSPDLAVRILERVLARKPSWEYYSKALYRISEDVVVKVTCTQNRDAPALLQWLAEQAPDVAAPRPLGMLRMRGTSFMFMTFVPGTTLEERWPSLSPDAKNHIRRRLNDALAVLRSIPHPSGTALGSPVGQRVCIDVRRESRTSTELVHESQLNDFLVHEPTSRAAPCFRQWLRSRMRDDHRIVFTHADFHPRNIMVADTPDGTGVELTGIIDWDYSGFYPEHWEMQKAMNTRSSRDESDWWEHLPACILGYDDECILDRLIECTLLPALA